MSKAKLIKEALERLAKIVSPEDAVKLAPKAREQYLKDLDLVFGSRKDRMIEQGFSPETLYHGSPISNIEHFREGKEGLFGAGQYFTDSPSIASDYAEKISPEKLQALQMKAEMIDPWTKTRKDPTNYGETVYPTNIRKGKILNMDNTADVEQWKKVLPEEVTVTKGDKNSDVYKKLQNYFEEEGYTADEAAEHGMQIFHEMGIDTVEHLGGLRVAKGKELHNVSITQDPSQVRSKFAAFDPRFKDSSNILAGSTGALIGAGALLSPEESEAAGIQRIIREAAKLGKTITEKEARIIKNRGITKRAAGESEQNIKDIKDIRSFISDPTLFKQIGRGVDARVYGLGNRVLKVPEKDRIKAPERFSSAILEDIGQGPKTKTISTGKKDYQIQDRLESFKSPEALALEKYPRLKQLDQEWKILKEEGKLEESTKLRKEYKALANKLSKGLFKKEYGIDPSDLYRESLNLPGGGYELPFWAADPGKAPHDYMGGIKQHELSEQLGDVVIPQDVHGGNIGRTPEGDIKVFDTSFFEQVQPEYMSPEAKRIFQERNIALPEDKKSIQKLLDQKIIRSGDQAISDKPLSKTKEITKAAAIAPLAGALEPDDILDSADELANEITSQYGEGPEVSGEMSVQDEPDDILDSADELSNRVQKGFLGSSSSELRDEFPYKEPIEDPNQRQEALKSWDKALEQTDKDIESQFDNIPLDFQRPIAATKAGVEGLSGGLSKENLLDTFHKIKESWQDPSKAPTGKDIALAYGASDEPTAGTRKEKALQFSGTPVKLTGSSQAELMDFPVEMIVDPYNLVGAGIISKGAEVPQKIKNIYDKIKRGKRLTQIESDQYDKIRSAMIKKNPKIAEKTTEYTPEEAKGIKFYTTKDKQSALGIKETPEGKEITGVFSGVGGRGDYLMEEAKRLGGTHLDHFDDPKQHLTNLYERHGFEEIRREPNWTEGEPDVIYRKLKEED